MKYSPEDSSFYVLRTGFKKSRRIIVLRLSCLGRVGTHGRANHSERSKQTQTWFHWSESHREYSQQGGFPNYCSFQVFVLSGPRYGERKMGSR